MLEKGTRLGKTDRDMTNKFINGLPSQWVFFIRAGRINNFREALHSAKIGEAHCYWIHVPPLSVVSNPSVTQQLPAPVSVNALTTPARGQNQRKPPRDRTCLSCNSLGHIKARCNWTGQGSPEPHFQDT